MKLYQQLLIAIAVWLVFEVAMRNEPAIPSHQTNPTQHFQNQSDTSCQIGDRNVQPSPYAANPRLNVSDKLLCFLHVGKTGGSTFQRVFVGDGKIVDRPQSIPTLGRWREFHVELHLRLTRQWIDYCDYLVAWVRNPVERAVSAYNMAFDPAWGMTPRELRERIRPYGNLNNLTERLYDDAAAYGAFRDIEHVHYNTAWHLMPDADYFADGNGKRDEYYYGNRGPISPNARLSEELIEKLVFVGATECFAEDLRRFASMFGVSDAWLNRTMQSTKQQRPRYAGGVDPSELSAVARRNMRDFFLADYDVIRELVGLGLVQCPRLKRSVCSDERLVLRKSER
ncbi:hypothetical protein ACHAXT_012777 [Thalassiosira profunda]